MGELCRRIATAGLLGMAAFVVAPSRAGATERGYPLIDTYSAVQVGADVIGLSAVQGADGVMYFGSNSLLSYDGDRWRSDPAASTYGLYGLDFGDDGRLWVGGMGEIGWFEQDKGKWQYRSLREQLPPEMRELGPVWHALAYERGALFASHNRLLYWDGAQIRSWNMPNTRRVRLLRAGEEIFVQHQVTGLYVMREGEPTLLVRSEVIGARSIFWIERRGAGFRVLANDGLFDLSAGQLNPVAGTATPYIQRHPPTTVVALPDETLAVGTMDDGIAFITREGTLQSVLNRAGGLDSTYSLPLAVDQSGALWAGTWSKIFRIPLASPTTAYDERASFPSEPAMKLGRHEGQLLVATTHSFYGLNFEKRRFEPITSDSRFVRDFYSASTGLITAGYRHVARVSNGSSTVIHETDQDVFTIVPVTSKPEKAYIADGYKIVELSLNGSSRVVAEGLPDYASSIAEDSAGTLWLGTVASGLYFVHPGDAAALVRRVGPESGLENPQGRAHAMALGDGTIVALTPAGAWVRAPGAESFTRVHTAPARTARASTVDPSGQTAWIVYHASPNQSATIAQIAVQAGALTWRAHSVEGISRLGVPAAIFAESVGGVTTTLWIGGTHGVLRHEVPDTIGVSTPRAPLLRAMARVGETELETIGTTALPASTRSIDFEFAIPEFGRRSALQLETRIDGVDTTWVPVAPGALRELNQIRPGHYTVRARAVAESGVASRETVLSFEVLKPWWQTTPARTGAVLAVGLAAFGMYRFRIRTLRRRNAELESKVRERTEQLERASAAKTEFVANMSHDIRNPLNGIVGLAYALEDTRLDERQRDLVATLRECTTYLSTLVDDVLDFAQIEAGRVELRPGPFNASELLGSIATTLKSDTVQSGATLVVECDPALPPHLLGDAGRIQQILVNYVSNALKYAGGTIRLSATLPAQAPEEVEFAVTDFGAGLTADEQAVLFTKFTRTAQARQHAVPGTGLGLAACRLLADIMGGSVGVISQPGEGATFFLRLPLVVATQRPTEPARALPHATVLLVEDTDYNAAAATAVLERLGLRCERARSGEEAIRLFSEKRYNIVLLDRNLPDMDGTEVAQRMRAVEGDGLRSILLAVTAYCTPQDRSRCLEAGMDAFVGKPLTPEKLRKVLLAASQPMRGTAAMAMHAATPAATPAPSLDTTLLSYLAEGGSSGLLEQIARYVANLERTQRELAQTMGSGDREALANTAHRLLGDARMINATALAAAVSALEHCARHGQLADCPARLELVMTEIARVTEALYRRPAARTT